MIAPVPLDSTHYAVVSAMITPALFLTAASSLSIAANNRLVRVVDRLRSEIEILRATPQGPSRTVLERRIAIHRRRSTLVLSALRMLYASISAFVCTSLGIAVDVFFGYRLNMVPTALAVIGVSLLLTASLCLGREARLGVRTLEMELKTQLDKDKAFPASPSA